MATTTKISLDFYNNSIVNVYAKQADANSRFINATCTDYGRMVVIDKESVSAFIRMKKADGTYIYNDVEILDDGTLLITLSQQMLAVSGKQTADIMLLSNPDITSDELTSLDSIDDLSNVSVISVMSFYIIVTDTAVDNSIISSTSEFDALVTATARMQLLEASVRKAESARVEAEEIREENEDTRIDNENDRIAAEKIRVSNENTRIDNEDARIAAEIKRQDDITGEAYRIANEAARQQNEIDRENEVEQKIEEWNTSVQNTIDACETATEAANDVVAEFETIKDQSGIVKQEEKGVANGIATLDENGKVPSEQLNIVNNLITTTTGSVLDASQGQALYYMFTRLQKTVEDLHQVYSGTTEPTSDIGKNGDIYMMIIE